MTEAEGNDADFICPKCGKRYRNKSVPPGSRVRCKKCSTIVTFDPETTSSLKPPVFKAGDTLGSYRITRRIGSGGMGIVYQAESIKSGRIVAIKSLTIKGADSISSSHTRRFLREARLAAAISHPNVVHVIGFIQKDGFYHIVLEYVSGGSLKTLLLKEGTLPEKRALEIALGTAQALVEAAKVRIVHRDIKPDNIMLSEDGIAKLADLGLATQEHDDTSDTTVVDLNSLETLLDNNFDASLTMSNVAMGTPAYMAPEQSRDSRSVDCRADIYSLGATLYHMLCGDPPYVADNMRKLMSMHRNADIPDINNIRTGLSDITRSIIERCLQKNPDQRFQTPVEVVAEIERALKGLEPSSDSTAGVGRSVRFYDENEGKPAESSASGMGESMLYDSAEDRPSVLHTITSRENLVFILAVMIAAAFVYLAFDAVDSWYSRRQQIEKNSDNAPKIEDESSYPAQ